MAKTSGNAKVLIDSYYGLYSQVEGCGFESRRPFQNSKKTRIARPSVNGHALLAQVAQGMRFKHRSNQLIHLLIRQSRFCPVPTLKARLICRTLSRILGIRLQTIQAAYLIHETDAAPSGLVA